MKTLDASANASASPAGSKERPILFSAPMVRAILEGRKTVTRRIVKPPKYLPDLSAVERMEMNMPDWAKMATSGGHIGSVRCPYGQPGDRLWVREAWMEYFGGEVEANGHGKVFYRASWGNYPDQRWRPSIHMPRRASRLSLEITSVRVERLQAITEAEAIAEGVGPLRVDGRMQNGLPATEGYADLWEAINGPKSWDLNPWVWAVSFRSLSAAQPARRAEQDPTVTHTLPTGAPPQGKGR